MKETRSIYNTEPLLNEVELVIKNGLDKILAKTLQRYELLERTHKQLMKLPSIREELNNDRNNSDSDSDSDSSDSDNRLNHLKQRSNQEDNFVNKNDLFDVHYKIQNLEAKYYKLNGLMDMLIDKIEYLNNNMGKMTCNPKPIANISIKPSVESSIVSACKNENIKVDIDSDIEDLDDSSSKVTLTSLPIIVKKMEAEESAIEVESVEDDKVVEEDTESVEEDVEVVDTESVEEEEEEEEEVVEAKEVVEKEEVVDTESVEEEEREEEEKAASEEEDDEVVEDENSVETETKEEQAESEQEQAESEQEQSESEQEQEKDDDEEELFEIDIDDITYCTNDENNGSIYELNDGDVGDKVGYFKEGEPFFYADEN
jgi:hypothetical protein